MSSNLPALNQAIAIRPESIASSNTVLRVKQHSTSVSGGDYTISQCASDGDPRHPGVTKLFWVKGHATSWRQRRDFTDATGLALFQLHRKGKGVTWFLKHPGQTEDSEPIATLAPRFHALKDKFDVFFTNAVEGGEQVLLEVRGQDVWKAKTHVYFKDALIVKIRVLNPLLYYVPFKRPEWEVEVAEGMDLALASVIAVLVAELASAAYKQPTRPNKPGYPPSSWKPGIVSAAKYGSVPLASGRGVADLGAAWVNDKKQRRIWWYAQQFGLRVVAQRLDGQAVLQVNENDRIEYPFGIMPDVSLPLGVPIGFMEEAELIDERFSPEEKNSLEYVRDYVQAESLRPGPPRVEDDKVTLDNTFAISARSPRRGRWSICGRKQCTGSSRRRSQPPFSSITADATRDCYARTTKQAGTIYAF
ncbi:hypothetical protein BBP40_009802 [Aspergillus hancockii]|nr:hypothetical protein BBP40_009802 [Aspergillus hancockii]